MRQDEHGAPVPEQPDETGEDEGLDISRGRPDGVWAPMDVRKRSTAGGY